MRNHYRFIYPESHFRNLFRRSPRLWIARHAFAITGLALNDPRPMSWETCDQHNSQKPKPCHFERRTVVLQAEAEKSILVRQHETAINLILG
ncbi:MAG: hypothetical protein PVI44_14895 [Balneolaceae bacterium]|jgi:hypothetical protein